MQTQSITITSSIIILIILLGSLLVSNRHRRQPLVKYTFYWILIIVGIIFLYGIKDFVKQHFITALFTSTVIDDDRIITIKRSINGHFIIDGTINNVKIKFLIDTGATSVVLSKDDAIKIGIDVNNLDYLFEVQTANGITKVAKSSVNIAIGGYRIENFNVLISNTDLVESLLGMSLINYFKSFKIEGDTLYLIY